MASQLASQLGSAVSGLAVFTAAKLDLRHFQLTWLKQLKPKLPLQSLQAWPPSCLSGLPCAAYPLVAMFAVLPATSTTTSNRTTVVAESGNY